MSHIEAGGWEPLTRTLWSAGAPYQELSYSKRSADQEEMTAVCIRQGDPKSSASITAVKSTTYTRRVDVDEAMTRPELDELIALFKALPGTPEKLDVEVI
ncbi:MAG: hypothetical protein WEC84_04890 [Candidatus Andersenbacteria bacterium]